MLCSVVKETKQYRIVTRQVVEKQSSNNKSSFKNTYRKIYTKLSGLRDSNTTNKDTTLPELNIEHRYRDVLGCGTQ